MPWGHPCHSEALTFLAIWAVCLSTPRRLRYISESLEQGRHLTAPARPAILGANGLASVNPPPAVASRAPTTDITITDIPIRARIIFLVSSTHATEEITYLWRRAEPSGISRNSLPVHGWRRRRGKSAPACFYARLSMLRVLSICSS